MARKQGELPTEARELAETVAVTIEDEVNFEFAKRTETMIEAPATIRKGLYGIDFLGGFSYLGGRETHLRNIASIGRFCSIASNVVSGQPEHPTDFLSAHPLFQGGFRWPQAKPLHRGNAAMVEKSRLELDDRMQKRFGKIAIGNDVWIGEGVFIRRGVTIGDGAVVAARSVVMKDVEPYAIVGGSPARLIRHRFNPDVIEELLRLSWWNYGVSALADADFTDIRQAIATIDRNIGSGAAELYQAPLFSIDQDEAIGLWSYDHESARLIPYAENG